MQTYRRAILIALDMLRADHLGCYGYPRPTTPNIDALAAESTRFEDCTTAFCCTMPSFTSMLSGKLPLNHGVVVNPWEAPNCRTFQLDDTTPTIAERLWSRDFSTAAVDNLVSFASHPNWFARGYRHLMNVTGTADPVAYTVRGEAINAELLPWLKAHGNEDFFLFVHYWDPHGPFTQPESYNTPFREMELPIVEWQGRQIVPGAGPLEAVEALGRDSIDEYDGATKFVDEKVGDVLSLLDEMGIADDTVVIIVSDHGRTDYGRPDHSRVRGVYQGTMHVPLIVHAPGSDQLETVAHPVHSTDIVPTILELLGRGSTDGLDGVSLVDAMTGGAAPHELIGACGTYLGAPQRLLRKGQMKLVRTYADAIADIAHLYDEKGNAAWEGGSKTELFDLEADPFELNDLAAEKPEIVAEMNAALEEWKAANADEAGAVDPLIENSRWGIRRDSTLVN